MSNAPNTLVRSEFEADEIGKADTGDVARKLTLFERISEMHSVRKLSILVLVIAAWEIYTRTSGVSELILPKFSATAEALFKG